MRVDIGYPVFATSFQFQGEWGGGGVKSCAEIER